LSCHPEKHYTIQYNPGRITSSTAKTDSQSIGQRPCFLCAKNRPAEQPGLPFKSDLPDIGEPLPYFPEASDHRRSETSATAHHWPNGWTCWNWPEKLSDFIVFYNGPKCGASAPDHFHFQAGQKGLMPIEKEWSHLEKLLIFSDTEVLVEAAVHYSRKCLVVEGQHPESMVHWMEKIIGSLPANHEENEEPMLNLLAGYEAGQWRVYLFPRGAHRPRQFFAEWSRPAAVESGLRRFRRLAHHTA
jgi:hypothetical protein